VDGGFCEDGRVRGMCDGRGRWVGVVALSCTMSFVHSVSHLFVSLVALCQALMLQSSSTLQPSFLIQHSAYNILNMSRLTRKASAIQLLSLNAEQAQTEQQALHAEVNSLKDALKRSHTAYVMLRDDVERFKGIARAQDVALKGLSEEVASMRREVAALRVALVPEKPVALSRHVVPAMPIASATLEGKDVRNHVRRW
jgi:hypothetical protein